MTLFSERYHEVMVNDRRDRMLYGDGRQVSDGYIGCPVCGREKPVGVEVSQWSCCGKTNHAVFFRRR